MNPAKKEALGKRTTAGSLREGGQVYTDGELGTQNGDSGLTVRVAMKVRSGFVALPDGSVGGRNVSGGLWEEAVRIGHGSIHVRLRVR